MKKLFLVGVMVLLVFGAVFAQEEQTVRDNSFGINVLGAVGGLIFGSMDIMMEFQHAFGPHLVLTLGYAW